MDKRLHLLAFLLFLIESVSMDVSLWRYEKDDVILPCTYRGPDVNVMLPDNDIKFVWRHNGTMIVHDVIEGKSHLSSQDQRFRGRTSIFPDDELHKGNFSLRLRNVTQDDSGTFICIVVVKTDHNIQAVNLHIKEKATKPISEDPKKQLENRSVQTCPEKRIFLLILLLACVLLLV